MNTKYIVLVVISIFALIQLGNGLKCFKCKDNKSCKKPETIVCNENYANETTKYLGTYYDKVINTTHRAFACLHHRLAFSTYSETTYRGCAYEHVMPCSLSMKHEYAINLERRECKACFKDKCNSPAIQSVANLPIIIFSIAAAFFCQTLFKE